MREKLLMLRAARCLVLVWVMMWLEASVPAAAQTPVCLGPQPMRSGWEQSLVAGCLDRDGVRAGGSQVIHLVAHKGRLYAATGYWMDRHSVVYGGSDPAAGWAQVLRLDDPQAPWAVDLNLGPRHLRTELLKSVTFTRDARGRDLPTPETLLIAATFDRDGDGGISVFVRDDATGRWTRTRPVIGSTRRHGEDNSVRAAVVHRDQVTGQERLFLTVGVLGVFTGRLDPAALGRIAWDPASEFGPLRTRALSIVEANGSLFLSEGQRIFRRIDGPAPTYTVVADLTGEADPGTDRATFQSIGGIRGLSAIPGPRPGLSSLVFVWTEGRRSRACVMRLDPQPDGTFARVREACLNQLISRHLDGIPVGFVIGAYNTFTPLRDPRTNELVHIIGLEAFLVGTGRQATVEPLTAPNQRTPQGGFYAGAIYAVRDAQGGWRVSEVNGRYQSGERPLVSIYTIALSPFSGADAARVYVGGYDPNRHVSTDTLWIASAPLTTVLQR